MYMLLVAAKFFHCYVEVISKIGKGLFMAELRSADGWQTMFRQHGPVHERDATTAKAYECQVISTDSPEFKTRKLREANSLT